MAVTDWRAWVSQGGGTQPGQTSPFPFPGVQPIPDQISGSASIPTYPNTPITINALDPFYVGTYPTGYGWVNQKEFVANSAGAQTPTMRPAIPGLTSP